MKLPKSILLNFKISAAKAEHEREFLNFYPKWILPLKLILVLAAILYFYLILFNLHPLSIENYRLLMNALLIFGASVVTATTLKTLIFTFLGYLKINVNHKEKNRERVTVIIKLGENKLLNTQTINSVIDQNHKNIELVLLSNIKNKYSDFDKNILNDLGIVGSKIKVSLIYSSNKSEIELLNVAIKTVSTKLIAVLKSYSIIEKNAIVNAVNHLKDENIIGVIGREVKNSKFSFGDMNEILNGLKFNVSNDVLINSTGPFLFRKKEHASVNFISLGVSKNLSVVVNQSTNDKKIIYDPSVKSKLDTNEKTINPISKMLELNLLSIDTVLQQWNYTCLKEVRITKRLKLNWSLLKVNIIPLVFLLYSLVFVFTVIASNNFEYLSFITLFLIITNFFISVLTIVIDFSIAKYILQSTFTKWFTDYLAITLKVFNTSKSVININSSLNYTAMSK